MSRIRPRQVALLARRLSLVLAALGVAWILWRFDTVRVPAAGSPVVRFDPGDRLVVDRRFDVIDVQDVVLVQDDAGRAHLVRVVELEGGAERVPRGAALRVRCDGDHPSSAALVEPTWVTGDAVRGRVLLVWPW